MVLALLAQASIWAFLFRRFLAREDVCVFHPLFFYLLFHGFVFVVRPILVYFGDFRFVWAYMEFFPSDAQFVFALAVSSFALITFYVAYPEDRRALSYSPARVDEKDRRALLWCWLT